MVTETKTQTRQRGMTKKTKDRIFITLMLALPIAQFLVFYVYVNLDSILLAFRMQNSDGTLVWTLANFKQMFTEFGTPGSEILGALKNTFIFFAINLLVILPLSFLLCYFLYKRVAGYKAFRAIFYLPNIISASVLVILYKYVIEINGPLAYVVDNLFGIEIPKFLELTPDALVVIVIYTVFFGLGGNLVLFSGAMNNIDPGVVDAARVDGVNMWQEIRHVVIPMIWPTLSTVILFAFIGIFNASGPILLFTKGDYNTYTIAYWIYDRVTFSGELYYPAAVGFFFTMIGMPIAMFMWWLMTRKDDATM